jgi:beta-glucosidase/6-phospho-beta-glucosidase/beta-galactosidase
MQLNLWNSAQFLDPLFTGDWTPERLEVLPPEVLPRFMPEQSAALKAAKPDFLALQFYDGAYGYYDENSTNPIGPYNITTTSADGVKLPVADSTWLNVLPASFRWGARRHCCAGRVALALARPVTGTPWYWHPGPTAQEAAFAAAEAIGC